MTCPCLKCYFCGEHLIIDETIFCNYHDINVYHHFSSSTLQKVNFGFKSKDKKYEVKIYLDINRFLVNRIVYSSRWDGEMSEDFIQMDIIPEFTPENIQDKIKTWNLFS